MKKTCFHIFCISLLCLFYSCNKDEDHNGLIHDYPDNEDFVEVSFNQANYIRELSDNYSSARTFAYDKSGRPLTRITTDPYFYDRGFNFAFDIIYYAKIEDLPSAVTGSTKVIREGYDGPYENFMFIERFSIGSDEKEQEEYQLIKGSHIVTSIKNENGKIVIEGRFSGDFERLDKIYSVKGLYRKTLQTKNPEPRYDATYRIQLVTNEEHEIQRVLGEGTYVAEPLRNDIAEALRNHLKNVFSYAGSDFDLSFYDLKGSLPRSINEKHSFDLQPIKHIYLSPPVGDYSHIASANIKGNNAVSFYNYDQTWHDASLNLELNGPTTLFGEPIHPGGEPWWRITDDLESEYIPATSAKCMRTGIFTGRRNLHAQRYGSYLEPENSEMRKECTFTLPLNIINCAAVLIIDPRHSNFSDIEVLTTGFATSFTPADSIFHFDELPYIKAEQIRLDNTSWMCFCTINFPSREPARLPAMAPTRSAVDTSLYPDNAPYRIDTDVPFLYDDCGQNIWRYEIYVKMKDANESVTRTVLNIRHPLRAGQLKIIKTYIDNRGVIRLYENEVGLPVDMEWQEGWRYIN